MVYPSSSKPKDSQAIQVRIHYLSMIRKRFMRSKKNAHEYTFIVMSENINGEKLQMGVDPRCLVLSRGKGKVAPKTAAEIFKFAF